MDLIFQSTNLQESKTSSDFEIISNKEVLLKVQWSLVFFFCFCSTDSSGDGDSYGWKGYSSVILIEIDEIINVKIHKFYTSFLSFSFLYSTWFCKVVKTIRECFILVIWR